MSVLLGSPEALGAGCGVASWYESGTTTANGERFNPDGLTAAHQTLPFNTKLRVTHNNRTVIVRINDRGPFKKGRHLDLSRGAAKALGIKKKGLISTCYTKV